MQAKGVKLVKNLISNARSPRQLGEMLRKVWRRLSARLRREDPRASLRWAAERAVDARALLSELDAEAWAEADAYMSDFQTEADDVIAGIGGVDLGGGADFRLLYFLVRLLEPAVVVETGVAAGYSSAAVLTAMERNGKGHLWSSDLPYPRLNHPAQHIGVLVRGELKKRWTLHIRGDRANLPLILSECDIIDILHYDSDKSVEGRQFAAKHVLPQMAPSGVVVFDDIQDNFHFRDHLASTGLRGHVFEFGGKFVGLVPLGGPLADHLA